MTASRLKEHNTSEQFITTLTKDFMKSPSSISRIGAMCVGSLLLLPLTARAGGSAGAPAFTPPPAVRAPDISRPPTMHGVDPRRDLLINGRSGDDRLSGGDDRTAAQIAPLPVIIRPGDKFTFKVAENESPRPGNRKQGFKGIITLVKGPVLPSNDSNGPTARTNGGRDRIHGEDGRDTKTASNVNNRNTTPGSADQAAGGNLNPYITVPSTPKDGAEKSGIAGSVFASNGQPLDGAIISQGKPPEDTETDPSGVRLRLTRKAKRSQDSAADQGGNGAPGIFDRWGNMNRPDGTPVAGETPAPAGLRSRMSANEASASGGLKTETAANPSDPGTNKVGDPLSGSPTEGRAAHVTMTNGDFESQIKGGTPPAKNGDGKRITMRELTDGSTDIAGKQREPNQGTDGNPAGLEGQQSFVVQGADGKGLPHATVEVLQLEPKVKGTQPNEILTADSAGRVSWTPKKAGKFMLVCANGQKLPG